MIVCDERSGFRIRVAPESSTVGLFRDLRRRSPDVGLLQFPRPFHTSPCHVSLSHRRRLFWTPPPGGLTPRQGTDCSSSKVPLQGGEGPSVFSCGWGLEKHLKAHKQVKQSRPELNSYVAPAWAFSNRPLSPPLCACSRPSPVVHQAGLLRCLWNTNQKQARRKKVLCLRIDDRSNSVLLLL